MCVGQINSDDLSKLIAIIPNEHVALHAIIYILYFALSTDAAWVMMR